MEFPHRGGIIGEAVGVRDQVDPVNRTVNVANVELVSCLVSA